LHENILNIRTHIIGMQQKVFEKTRFMRCNSMGGTIYKLPMKADGEQQQVIMLSRENILPIWENSEINFLGSHPRKIYQSSMFQLYIHILLRISS